MASENKNVSKIESLIDDIESLVENSKTAPFSPTKVLVSKEELIELTRELRMKAPDEIKRYRKMIENRDAIMEDAKIRAEQMLADAEQNIQSMIDEHEIVQQALSEADAIMADANNQANELLYAAEREADMIRKGAVRYMAENLTKIQNIIDSTMTNVDARYRGMMNTLEKYSALVRENKEELLGTQQEVPQEQFEEQMEEQEDNPIVDPSVFEEE